MGWAGNHRNLCRTRWSLCLAITSVAALAQGAVSSAFAAPALTVRAIPDKLPEAYVVLPFENRSGVNGLTWMEAACAFSLAEKAEGLAGLRPVYGALVLDAVWEAPRGEAPVAEIAARTGASWVWTGWVRRPDWKLELGVSLWKVTPAGVSRVGEVVNRGEFTQVHEFISGSLKELSERAGLSRPDDDWETINWVPTLDFYAFTLFGRGLTWLLSGSEKKTLELAKKNLERTALIDPKMAETHRLLSEVYRRLGKSAVATGRTSRALEHKPKYPAALLSSASSAEDSGKHERAIELFAQVLSLRPWDLETRYRLGNALWETGRADESFRELSRVVDRQPKHIRARRTLVLIHASRGNDAGLIRELEAIAELDREDVAIRLDLGAAYAAVGRHDDAVKSYKSVIEIDPEHVQALKFLGDLSKRAGKVARAIRYYGQAMKADPNDPRPYFLLGAAYVEQGDDSAAKRVYRLAQRFRRFRAEAYNNLGAIAYREGKLKESMWYLRRAVTQKPDRVRYRYNYALSLSASSETDEALAHIEAGLARDDNHVELNYLRGVVLLRKGQAEEARQSFEKALARDASHQGARHNLQVLDELKRRAEQGEIVGETK